jgi:hypothetical protein
MVAKRTIVLKYMVVTAHAAPPRDLLNQWMAEWSELDREKFLEDAERERKRIWRGLKKWRLPVSPRERIYFKSSAATMSDRQQTDASWRREAFQTLVWALGLIPSLPPPDIPMSGELLKAYPSADIREYIRSATLRKRREIDHQQDVAELWHWRSRTRQLIEEGRPFNTEPFLKDGAFRSYDDVIRVASERAQREGLARVIDGDFSLKGKAYRDLTDEEWSEVRSITIERHFALNWVCGYAPRNLWDETPTDT